MVETTAAVDVKFQKRSPDVPDSPLLIVSLAFGATVPIPIFHPELKSPVPEVQALQL